MPPPFHPLLMTEADPQVESERGVDRRAFQLLELGRTHATVAEIALVLGCTPARLALRTATAGLPTGRKHA